MHPPQVSTASAGVRPVPPVGHAGTGVAIRRWFCHEWATVLFVVCLVHALHANDVLWPISKVSLLVLAHQQSGGALFGGSGAGHSASALAAESASTWLVGIGPEEFEDRYGERRPLSRCTLADDLRPLLSGKGGPRVLAIDLDLSPLARRVETDDEHRCQAALDALLDNPGPTRVVLMEPFPGGSHRHAEIEQWKRERHAVEFADTTLEYPLNVAIEYECLANGFAELAYVAHVQGSPELPCKVGHGHERHPISYRAYKRFVHEVPAAALRAPLPPMHDKAVFFGLRAGASDLAVTPLGEVHGLAVHAAKYVTFEHRFEHAEKWGLVLDLVFAFGFSAFIAWFVGKYLRHASKDSVVAYSYLSLQLAVFVVVYLVAALAALCLAFLVAVYLDVVLEPLLIALGLAVDGFVIAGWSHVGATRAKAGHARPLRPKALVKACRRCWAAPSYWLKAAPVWLLVRWGAFWLLLGYVALHLLRSHP